MKEYYYDIVAQIWTDGNGVHYAVGQNFDENNDEEPVAAHGTVDSIEEAIDVLKREINGLLDA